MRSTAACIIFSSIFILSVGPAYTLTCDECKEMYKNKVSIQQELQQKDTELNAAFKAKQFQQVNDLRARMLELRKKMIELRASDEKCEQACKPDVVKAAECKKLLDDLITLESEAAEGNEAKVDALYREFRSCNDHLQKIKQTE